MWGTSNQHRAHQSISSKLKLALAALLEAFQCAQDTDSDPWEFAIAIRRFQKLGLSETDMRWLVKKGYVDHAREITRLEDDGRQFRPTANLSFSKKSCFALTEGGVLTARSVTENPVISADEPCDSGNGQAVQVRVPHWDGETRELRIDGRIVKRFKWQAVNQEIVLSAFQEDSWPAVIDDPLPPKPQQDPKSRLHDTIKALNRHQQYDVIRFHGNGTGEGIRWERIEARLTERG